MSSELIRPPLLELTANGATPMPHQKITTPPESGAPIKKTFDFGSPVPNHDTVRPHSLNHRSVLLSPAFLSPQNPLMESPTKFSEPLDDDRRKKKKKKEKKFDILSSEKPPYSYATLIGMSILSHPEKKLTLSLIYSWISDTFKYYKREDVGWQNSIRHNLSLNKAFIKGEKSKDGKGHFWCIEAGCEDQFLKSRNSKKSSYYEIMDQIYSSVKPHSASSIPSSPTYNYDDYKRPGEDNRSLQPPTKRSRLLSASTEKGSLDSIPNLGAPFTHWNSSNTPSRLAAPQKGQNFVYHGSIHESNSPLINDNLFNTPQLVVTESPNKPLLAGKNLTFTSSFSCNSNLELSPIRPNETGPLLEPLTPGKVYKAGAINHHIPNLHYTPSQTHHLQLPQTIGKASNNQLNLSKTPKSGLKTPIRSLRTPQASTSQRRLWNSPSYLDDFYYSPLVTSQPALHSYDDDDMILRAFELPANSRRSVSSNESSRNLFNELKKADRTLSSSNSGVFTDRLHQRSDSSTTEPDA